uniref:Uncharacterized protein n=1 Tax=mine drainage metagenome TaxID=410659 RepID=E6PS00_9ZZZZ
MIKDRAVSHSGAQVRHARNTCPDVRLQGMKTGLCGWQMA